jgi:hypothetical protein
MPIWPKKIISIGIGLRLIITCICIRFGLTWGKLWKS